MTFSLLLIERDTLLRDLYAEAMRAEGFEVEPVPDVPLALATLERRATDLIIAAVGHTEPHAATLLREARRLAPRVDLLALVERGSSSGALQALRDGAFDCLLKPVPAPHLVAAVHRCLRMHGLLAERPALARELALYERCGRLLRETNIDALPTLAISELVEHAGGSQAVLVRLGEHGEMVVAARAGLSQAAADRIAAGWSSRGRDLRPPVREPVVVEIPGRGMAALFAPSAPDEMVRGELTLLARFAAQAMELAARYGVASSEALDPLTEVFQEGYVRRVLGDQILRGTAGGPPVSLLTIDLDGFRAVNDRHGHLAASHLLIEAARLLERCVREQDVVGRTGGDEYAVVLLGIDAQTARSVAERIRRVFASHLFGVREGLDVRLTLSIGVASCPEHGTTDSAVLSAAEAACAAAKARGGDAIFAADPR